MSTGLIIMSFNYLQACMGNKVFIDLLYEDTFCSDPYTNRGKSYSGRSGLERVVTVIK